VAPIEVTSEQIAAFRLARHHLADDVVGDIDHVARVPPLVSVCGDVCGIQAQVVSSAELAIWTRRHSTTRAEIREALWEKRALVKTSLMRLTLHYIPATDYTLYITALRDSRIGMVLRLLARFRITPEEATALNVKVVDALANGPMTQQELLARMRANADKRMRKWLAFAWTAFRGAIVDGLICYGPPKGSEVTFVRVDRWLPRQTRVDDEVARQTLMRRFLAAYGPGTVRDFCKWSNITVATAKVAWRAIEPELAEVSVDGQRSWILKSDRRALAGASLDPVSAHLLPSFDPFLLAHAEKDHLVERRHYKRVYRNQGWLTPVVLVGGRVAGVWSLRAAAKRMLVDVDLFARQPRPVREAIEGRASAMGRFLGAECEVTWA